MKNRLDRLKTSISELSKEEVFKLISEVRDSRKIQKVKRKKGKKVGVVVTMESLLEEIKEKNINVEKILKRIKELKSERKK